MNKRHTSEGSQHLHKIIFVFAPLFFLLVVLVASLIAIQYPQTYSSKAAACSKNCWDLTKNQCLQYGGNSCYWELNSKTCKTNIGGMGTGGTTASDIKVNVPCTIPTFSSNVTNLPVGSDCTTNSVCASNICSDYVFYDYIGQSIGTCKGLPTGSDCTSNAACASNICSDYVWYDFLGLSSGICKDESTGSTVPPPSGGSSGGTGGTGGVYQEAPCTSAGGACTDVGWTNQVCPNGGQLLIGYCPTQPINVRCCVPPAAPPPNNPPTCTITGSTNAKLGDSVDYTATCNDPEGLSSIKIYFSEKGQQNWRLVGGNGCLASGTSATCKKTGNWIAPLPAGAYDVIANGYDSAGARCSGNPYYDYTSGGWSHCGGNSALLVTVTSEAACTVPSAPTSLIPPKNTIITGDVTLQWSTVTGATSYPLRVNDNLDNSIFNANGTLVGSCNTSAGRDHVGDECVDNLTNTSYRYTVEAGHTYIWWVQAKNSCGWSDSPDTAWSDMRGDGGEVCAQVITHARNDTTGVCQQFPDSCIPSGWTVDPSCAPCALKSRGDADCRNDVNEVDYDIWRREYRRELNTTTADFVLPVGVDEVDFDVWRRGYTDPSVAH